MQEKIYQLISLSREPVWGFVNDHFVIMKYRSLYLMMLLKFSFSDTNRHADFFMFSICNAYHFHHLTVTMSLY